MDFTVGTLEDKLRKFPKETKIHVSCNSCKVSASGSESIIKVNNNTNQTFGYIELEVNSVAKPKVELASDKERFYKEEMKRLNRLVAIKDYEIGRYKTCLRGISDDCRYMLDEMGVGDEQ